MSWMKELDLRRIQGTIGGRSRGSSPVSCMSPINGGNSVNLRLSDKAATEMSKRKVTHVRFSWGADANDRTQLLVIEPSADGLKVRYSNKGLRPHIHVPTVDIGKASYAAGGSLDCPEERIDGDEFAFRVPDGLHFDAVTADDSILKDEAK